MLTDEYRLKAATAVSWSGDLKIACVATDGLFSMTVALIRLIGFLMLGVSKMIFHLSL
jgi:hypothetical protein